MELMKEKKELFEEKIKELYATLMELKSFATDVGSVAVRESYLHFWSEEFSKKVTSLMFSLVRFYDNLSLRYVDYDRLLGASIEDIEGAFWNDERFHYVKSEPFTHIKERVEIDWRVYSIFSFEEETIETSDDTFEADERYGEYAQKLNDIIDE